MFRAILRSLLAVVVSLTVAFALVVAVELLCGALHPVPPGVDLNDLEACRDHVASFPDGVLAIAVAGWSVTVFASVWLATRLGSQRHPAHGYGVGVLLILLVAGNQLMLPYPRWFDVANMTLLPAMMLLAVRLALGTRATPNAASAESAA